MIYPRPASARNQSLAAGLYCETSSSFREPKEMPCSSPCPSLSSLPTPMPPCPDCSVQCSCYGVCPWCWDLSSPQSPNHGVICLFTALAAFLIDPTPSTTHLSSPLEQSPPSGPLSNPPTSLQSGMWHHSPYLCRAWDGMGPHSTFAL